MLFRWFRHAVAKCIESITLTLLEWFNTFHSSGAFANSIDPDKMPPKTKATLSVTSNTTTCTDLYSCQSQIIRLAPVLKKIIIVSYHILVVSLILVTLFKTEPSERD